jgi:hypothetical protein
MSSEIKADKWSPASGTSATIGDSGDTYTVPSGVTLDIASGATLDATGATVTGITSTTINNNADNRVITGSGTANTLNGEANLTYSSPDLTVTGGNPSIIHNNTTSGGDSGIKFQGSGTDYGFINLDNSDGALDLGTSVGWSTRFYTNNTEKMRITSGGQMHLGNTSGSGVIKVKNTGNATYAINAVGNTTETVAAFFNNSTTGTHRIIDFLDGQSQLGGSVNINCQANSVSYETSSDYRLKENIVDLDNGITRLKQLKPKRFNFIADETNTLRDGFLAHETQSVVLESASGTKDGTVNKTKVVLNNVGEVLDENIEEADWTQGKTEGKYPSDSTWEAEKTVPVYQGIDQSKLVPLLTAALKEAITKIETLEAKVAALESA